ncbi:MAG: sigma-70 family RNA polymerase sigma factor [Planctomycetota bacterium]|jgi:RNA polymerase sigma-70 factor (ECF subfamily)
MSRIQAGDVKAFELLYARYTHPLLNFFFRMCFDRTSAEDCLQETFLRVWRARRTYRPIGKVSTWLFQIAKNHWFNERDKMRRRPFHAVAGGDEAQAQWSNVADASADLAPDAVASAMEMQAAIQRAVAGLSDKLRVVFVMARYQRLPYREIAAILEIPVGTVKSRVALAEKNLRAQLREYLENRA